MCQPNCNKFVLIDFNEAGFGSLELWRWCGGAFDGKFEIRLVMYGKSRYVTTEHSVAAAFNSYRAAGRALKLAHTAAQFTR